MKITGKRVRNVERYLLRLRPGTEFRAGFHLVSEIAAAMKKVGLTADAKLGATALPPALGPVSTFNAEGREIPRKDLPKEPRYITTIEWTWEQWDGPYSKTVTEERDVWRECYQRDVIPPPAIELTLGEVNGRRLIVSPKMINTAVARDRVRHTINLMLELFGSCELIKADLQSFDDIPVKKVNWRLLPPGRYPWDKVSDYLKVVLRTKDPRLTAVIYNRHETIKHYKPDEVYVGEGGFERYVAYAFRSRRLVVLECTEKDNAIYVFGSDWKVFSKLTKAEILRNEHQLSRIIHSGEWRAVFDKLMRKYRDAA